MERRRRVIRYIKTIVKRFKARQKGVLQRINKKVKSHLHILSFASNE